MRRARAALFFLTLSATPFAHDGGTTAPAVVAPERLTGTVEEIVIDDRVTHAMRRYRELRTDDGATIPLQGAVADSLQAGSRVEVVGRRNGKPLDVDSTRTIAAPKAAETATIQLDGTLSIAHADDFASARSEFIYEIRDDAGNTRRLELASLPAPLHWGMRISVSGRISADGSSLRPARITIIAPAPEERGGSKGGAIPTKAANPMLLILANFNNTATPSFTSSQAQQVMTSNSNSVANYFGEVSFGQQTLSVTVTDWVTMAMSQPGTCDTPDWQGIGNAATAAAAAANGAWNSASYSFVVYLFPTVPACGWNGLAYIGSPHKAYINGTNSFITQVIAHEMGHNFGLLHAGSLDCGGAPIGGSCTVAEYGDPFDTMGNQRSMHYNAEQKRKLNWIAAGTVATHSAGTLTYSLAPIESAGGALYAVKIPAAANRTYWVEFRQPIGFDGPLSAFPNNGAQIRVATPFETLCSGCDSLSNDTQLLDMTTGTSTFTDAALLVGQSFSDNTYGVNISVVSATASALTVQVSSGGSVATTTTTLTSAPNPSTVGASVTFTATVSGTAPTGTVAFTDGGSSIAGCSAAALGGSGNSRVATCTTGALSAGAHGVAATYGGDGANAGSTGNTVVQNVNATSTTTGIASAANPALLGAAVTFTATVTGAAPTGTVAFNDNGSPIAGCTGAALGGSGNVRTAICATAFGAIGNHSIVAVYSGNGSNAGSTSPALTEVINAASTAPGTNVAAAANGGVASASSTYSGAYPLAAVNDGDRTGATWANGGGWADATNNSFPDWVQINFSGGAKTIDRVVVYTLSDTYGLPVDPTDAQTFGLFGIVDFTVQTWNGSAWNTVATVTGNNLVKRTVTFPAVSTDRIRVTVSNALYGYSRIVELEAWTP
ncbi:MAG TPA: Ig-like domain repeat protein [Casimicrobiaceae bacterium]